MVPQTLLFPFNTVLYLLVLIIPRHSRSVNNVLGSLYVTPIKLKV